MRFTVAKQPENEAIDLFWVSYAESVIPTHMLDESGTIVRSNEAMVQLTGYTIEDAPSLDVWLSKVYPEYEYRESIVDIDNRVRRRELAVKKQVFIVTRKDGAKRHVEFSVYDLRLNGKPTGLMIS